jgi:hypothetical protein
LDVTQFDWTQRRSATGPVSFQWRSSLDGFATPFTTIGVADTTANLRFSIGNSGGLGGALDLTSPVTFRLYGYNAEGLLGTYRLGIALGEAGATTLPANSEISGDLTALQVPVPEPGSLFLLGLGTAGLAVRTRLKKKRSAQH